MKSKFSQELFDDIINELSTTNKGLKTICKEKGTDHSTFFTWINKDVNLYNTYARAKELQIEVLANEIIDIANESKNDLIPNELGGMSPNHAAVQRAKLQIDTRKWIMSKLAPKKYGDKIDITSNQETIKQVFNIGGQDIEL